MIRTLVIAVLSGALVAVHQYLLVVCSEVSGVVIMLDVIALPMILGLPFLGGFLASRGREQAFMRHGAAVGAIVATIGMAAASLRQAAEPASAIGGWSGLAIQFVTYLIVLVNLVIVGVVGAYVAEQVSRRKQVEPRDGSKEP